LTVPFWPYGVKSAEYQLLYASLRHGWKLTRTPLPGGADS